MKTKKDKTEKNYIKLDKINKRINIGIIIFIIIYILNNLIMYFSDNYAAFFITHILNNINGLFYYLCSYIPYLSYILLGIYALYVIIYLILDIYYESFSKDDYITRSRHVNRLYRGFIIISLFLVIPNLLAQFENHLPNFDKLLFPETQTKTYTKEDLINLNTYLGEQVIKYSDEIPRNKDRSIDYSINYNEQAINDLKKIADRLNLLKGLYPQNSSHINDFIRGFVGSKTIGFTTPYSTYFDYDASPTSIISTITHEFCHTKGIVRENETVYCAFLAGTESENKLSNYAAYLEAFSWTSAALLTIDYEIGDEIEDRVLSKCLTDNYSELCDVYTKNTNEYIRGSKYLKIVTYQLHNYIDYKSDLMDALYILSNNNAEFTIGKTPVTSEVIEELIETNSKNHLTITIPLNNNRFSKIKEALKKDYLFLSVYQKNKEEKESSNKLDDANNYYLAPFKDKDENMFFNMHYGSIEYEYSRVARLFLEHYEKNKS